MDGQDKGEFKYIKQEKSIRMWQDGRDGKEEEAQGRAAAELQAMLLTFLPSFLPSWPGSSVKIPAAHFLF